MISKYCHKDFLTKIPGILCYLMHNEACAQLATQAHIIRLKNTPSIGCQCVVHQLDLATSRRQERLVLNTSRWCTLHTFYQPRWESVTTQGTKFITDWTLYMPSSLCTCTYFVQKLHCICDRKHIFQMGLFGLQVYTLFLECHEYLSERHTQYVFSPTHCRPLPTAQWPTIQGAPCLDFRLPAPYCLLARLSARHDKEVGQEPV